MLSNTAPVLLLAVLWINLSDQHILKIGSCTFVWDEPCDSQLVKFYLYTRRSSNYEYIQLNDNGQNNITSSHYNPDRRSVVLIHGYRDSFRQQALHDIKDEYLKKEDLNAWFVDLAPLVATDCYFSAVFNVKYAGKCLSSLIKALEEPQDLHVIGFSLGAHVAGVASNYSLPYLIPRITGLDPALPLFLGLGSQRRLGPEDARFVDVYHTNAFFQGNFLPLGHIDFFVNGGIAQPGCGFRFDSIMGCSHIRSVLYFAESINSETGFWGWQCKTYFNDIFQRCKVTMPLYEMGDNVNTTARGLMYVETNSQSPFAKGKPGQEET